MSTMALDSSMASLSLAPTESANNDADGLSSSSSFTNMSGHTTSHTFTGVGATSASSTSIDTYRPICPYFERGMCRFGTLCRFSHDISASNNVLASSSNITQEQPSTSRRNWVNAPVFVPKGFQAVDETLNVKDNVEDVEASALIPITNKRSWADVVGAGASASSGSAITRFANLHYGSGMFDEVCPYERPCPYGVYCAFALHFELCEMCDQFCLHPKDEAQRKKHKKECLQQHEQAMELSFAIARSKDKTCGICFDTILEKPGREKRFGILPNCNHIFCLECIRKWRQAKQFEHKITRSCPECRVSSDFVCPSAFWVETKEEKDKLLHDYRNALGVTDCKYFKKGDGKCPFGNKCFYKHALPDGEVVDVGCPKKGRKIHRSNNEIINLLDIYLYEFLEQRDYSFLDFLANSTSDESDFGDDYDD